jgi:hypothetical protein
MATTQTALWVVGIGIGVPLALFALVAGACWASLNDEDDRP